MKITTQSQHLTPRQLTDKWLQARYDTNIAAFARNLEREFVTNRKVDAIEAADAAEFANMSNLRLSS